MTAEPSAADVQYSPPQPYRMPPMGRAPVKKKSKRDEQENRPQQQQQQDDDENDEEDEEDDNEEDDSDVKTKGKAKKTKSDANSNASAHGNGADDDAKAADGDDKNVSKKSRRELPPHTVAILKGWMLSPEHVKHPYPTDEDKQMLLKKTGINMKQLTNWFTNARKRIWKPMMRREHSRQLQSAMEYEKARPREAFSVVPVAPPQFREGEYPARPVVRHSFDAGSLGPPHHQQPPFDPYARGGGRDAAAYQHGHPPPSSFPSRAVRSMSEALPGTSHEMDDYIDAMRIRKRVHERSPDGVEVDAMGPSEKRYRRSAIMSPRSLKVLQDWVVTHSHSEYPLPSDTEKLQLSRDTGLDVQQIEMWFKNNRERIGAANFAIQNGAPGLSPSRRSLPGRSIPSRDNPMFPPPQYGERRSIPSSGNPMFPPRPAASMRSSIPGNGNPQFPPPPARRESAEGYYPHGPQYGNGQYPPPHAYGGADQSRPIRSMSINTGQQYMRPQPRPSPVNNTAPVGAGVLPSLANRSVIPRVSPGPTMGQPRDARSHTLDMGLFTDARRRKMNFQDILASTSSSHPPPAPPAAHPAGMPETSRHPNSVSSSTESVYPNAIPAYAGPKSFERSHIGQVPACGRCGARLGSCGCGDGERRIV
ncbi:Homebox domain-containing protein, partial [Globisporangium splendens]